MNVEPLSFSHYPALVEELLRDLFGDSFGEQTGDQTGTEASAIAGALVQPFAQWVSASKPFLAFAQTYRSKIRKKIRMCRNVEEARNLDCELRTAYLLLQAPRFAVAYEPHTKARGRSADLAVTFRTHTTFHVEVTRLRASQREPQQDGQPMPSDEVAPAGTDDPAAWLHRYAGRRLADLVCEKLGQLAPDTPNVLWVWNESPAVQTLELGPALQALKRGVEQRDPGLYARYGFAKPADFLYNYQRLSAILIQPLAGAGQGSLLWWQSKDARHPLPSNIAALLRTLVVADASPPFTYPESEF